MTTGDRARQPKQALDDMRYRAVLANGEEVAAARRPLADRRRSPIGEGIAILGGERLGWRVVGKRHQRDPANPGVGLGIGGPSPVYQSLPRRAAGGFGGDAHLKKTLGCFEQARGEAR